VSLLKRFIDRYAPEHLTIYIVALSAITSGYVLMTGSSLGLLQPKLLSHPWDLVFFPFRLEFPGAMPALLGGGWGGLLIRLYLYWMFGSIVEAELGRVRYNVYVWMGVVMVTLTGVFIPEVTAVYIYYSVFFAVAYLAPNMELYIMFILPVKIKWLAWLAVAGIVLESLGSAAATGNYWLLAGPFLTFLNFFIFFGREFLETKVRAHSSGRRMKAMATVRVSALHRCTVCGMTENDDPNMEFRFCVDCSDHEYCMTHLRQHEHIRE
jgi:hypothetical protein